MRRLVRWGCLTRLAIGALVVAAGVALGSYEWEIPWAIPLVSRQIGGWTGWSVQIGRLWVAPWAGVRAEEVSIGVPGGGRLHVRRVALRDLQWDGVRGQVRATCQMRQIHIDPGSWRIHRPSAVEWLATGPVVETLRVRLGVGRRTLEARWIRLSGRALRGHGQALWAADGTLQCWVRGQLATDVLVAMGFNRLRGPWEPFQLKMAGKVRSPRVVFHARFGSLTTGPFGE